jgi:hypothetical protein
MWGAPGQATAGEAPPPRRQRDDHNGGDRDQQLGEQVANLQSRRRPC